MERKKYPIRAEDYRLFEVIGQGASAKVHRSICIPLEEVVAIKIVDFERQNSDLNNICREAQTMILIDHPNVLNAHCSFANDHNLWVVMPYMAGGSCLHIMKSVYPDGLKEVVIATVLREVLKALEYLHEHGHIHRDVKAGNILFAANGGIKLGDFGVSACLFDSGDRQRTRNTFVGTPCWMAPEVMEQLHGYDFKADIWSFGITALELAHGHAPFSKYPPIKVLLMTLQNAPPGLDYESDNKFSRSFKQMIAMCLVKDPSKRPTARKLLKQPFFKQARSSDYISRKILEGLPTLGDRVQALKDKEENLLAQKKVSDEKMEEISQNVYNRGISSWNFDIEDLKAQASLIPDGDDTSSVKDPEGSSCSLFELDTSKEKIPEGMSYSRSCSSNGDENDAQTVNKTSTLSSPDQTLYCPSLRSDFTDYDRKVDAPGDQNITRYCQSIGIDVETYAIDESEISERQLETLPSCSSFHERRFSTSSLSSDFCSISKGESTRQQNQLQHIGNGNGIPGMPLEATSKASNSKSSVVQQRGRFKVTSENAEAERGLPPLGLTKSQSLQVISPFTTSALPSPCGTPNATLGVVGLTFFPMLNSILHANIVQRDNILSLMKQLNTGDGSVNPSYGGSNILSPASMTEKSLLEAAHEKEKELMQEVIDMQWRLSCAQDEIQRLKSKIP